MEKTEPRGSDPAVLHAFERRKSYFLGSRLGQSHFFGGSSPSQSHRCSFLLGNLERFGHLSLLNGVRGALWGSACCPGGVSREQRAQGPPPGSHHSAPITSLCICLAKTSGRHCSCQPWKSRS